MDTSEEHIDIVGDDSDTRPVVEERHKTEEQEAPVPSHVEPPVVPSHVPLTVQITADSEPSGAKKRKPLKTTKLQVNRTLL